MSKVSRNISLPTPDSGSIVADGIGLGVRVAVGTIVGKANVGEGVGSEVISIADGAGVFVPIIHPLRSKDSKTTRRRTFIRPAFLKVPKPEVIENNPKIRSLGGIRKKGEGA